MLDIDTIGTIENTARVQLVTFEPEFSTICSEGKAPFWGTVLIQYRPIDSLLELASVESWVHSLALDEMTIEDLCRAVFDALTIVLGAVPMSVTVKANTTVHAPATASIERGF